VTYKTLFDSVDKVVTKYMAAVTTESFTYAGATYAPAPLYVSPSVLRNYSCPAKCGACCRPFTMDWLPDEPRPPGITERTITFNGRAVQVFSDTQEDRKKELACRYLRIEDGRCGIHDVHTLSCDFPMITVKHLNNSYYITGQLFGRLGQMRRPAGGVGGACTMSDVDPASIKDVVRKFRRLERWCDHFGIANRVDNICLWAESSANGLPIAFSPDENSCFERLEDAYA
jgi:Fe-S-cluster containining protein